MSIRVSGPMRSSPTALRLAEVLSAWLPGSSEGVYSRYLQSFSPKFDHLLTYSRYDRLWRLSQHGPSDHRYSFQISLLSSPVHVIDTVKTKRTIANMMERMQNPWRNLRITLLMRTKIPPGVPLASFAHSTWLAWAWKRWAPDYPWTPMCSVITSEWLSKKSRKIRASPSYATRKSRIFPRPSGYGNATETCRLWENTWDDFNSPM